MYKSKNAIEKKLKQVKYIYKEISKYKNKIIVKNGLAEETGSYPLLVHISSFLAQARSILQYAHKEAKESGQLSKYNNYVSNNRIIKFFKMIRDSDIHEYTIGSHTTITGESPIIFNAPETDTSSGKEAEITITLCNRIKTDNSFIQQLEAEGEKDLAEAARDGKELYEELKCDGEKDIFKLCEKYIIELELFVNYGKSNGFIA